VNGPTALNPQDPSQDLPPDQSVAVSLNQVPTGIKLVNNTIDDSGLTLGRCATLLFPKNMDDPSTDILTRVDMSNPAKPVTTTIGAFQNNTTTNVSAIDYNAVAITVNGETTASHITQSRIDAAATTPPQIMALLQAGIPYSGPTPRPSNQGYEANHFCYRHAALRSIFDTEILRSGAPSIPNGFFRMHPIALQGVTSFIVEWTDGGTYLMGDYDPISGQTIPAGSPLIGTTRWFGLGHPKSGTLPAAGQGVIDPSGTGFTIDKGATATAASDEYIAVFSFDNRTLWPTALRFRYHVADPNGRLQNGRDFVEVVKLPG
jgi:hypothetical protein